MKQDELASNEPTGYDESRVAQLQPLREAIEKLPIPALRSRKISGILNALEMQIEDGGDSPEVNRLLRETLRLAIRHQVDEQQGQATLQAVDAFELAEAKRGDPAKAGVSPMVPPSKERMGELIQQGYKLLRSHRETEACDRWLEAWELVKQLARPEWRTTEEFDLAYRGHWELVFNWCQDLEAELGNAGIDNQLYHEHRLRYAREFLGRFPSEDANHYVNFMRAQGEALWELGRQAEAEEVYQSLVDRFPHEAWGYIGWADRYWLFHDSSKEYGKAEEIMKRALVRPNLNDRGDLLERLEDLYAEWGKPEEQAKVAAQRAEGVAKPKTGSLPAFLAKALGLPTGSSAPTGKSEATPTTKPGRNAPCWCGSGKKYKKCYLMADEKAGRR